MHNRAVIINLLVLGITLRVLGSLDPEAWMQRVIADVWPGGLGIVSSDVWHQPNHLDPPFVRLGFAAVELTIMPLPELSPSTGADQLRRVIGRMLSLPSASPPPPCALVEGVTGAAGHRGDRGRFSDWLEGNVSH